MRIIVATTGATGAVRETRHLAALREPATEPHVVFRRLAGATHAIETGHSARDPAFIESAPARNSNQKTLDEAHRSDGRRVLEPFGLE
jgi:3-polyprenyl-4-hydroxybenzoate decarboxylase